jgi:hypothetical protein
VCIPLSASWRKSIHWFQEKISEIVNNQSFLNILSNLPLDLQCTQLKSCIRLRVGAWLFIHPIIFFIRLASDIFPPWCDVHQVGPPPFISLWLATLHLWPTFKLHGDSPSLLCSWWGKDDIPQCCMGCLCIHHERC